MLDCMATYSLIGHNTAQFINIVFARSCSIRHQCVAGARQHTFHCFALCQKKKTSSQTDFVSESECPDIRRIILYPQLRFVGFSLPHIVCRSDE